MSRMLEALKQIEARSPRPRRLTAPKPAPAQPSALPREDGSTDKPSADRPTAQDGPIRDSVAIEQTLDEAENAASLAGGTCTEAASLPDAPQVTRPATPGAVCRPPQRRPAELPAADGQGWPCGPTEEHARAYGHAADNVVAQLTPNRPAVLMFTSPGDAEAKTELLVPLAAALAQRTTGDVLLVDGNLRQPALAGYLGIDCSAGLANVLLGTLSWRQVVRDTAVAGLRFLPGVKLPTSHDDLPRLGSLPALLKELRHEFRLVLLDAASLAHSEVAPMGRDCDGTYLVVQLDHTTRRAARDSLRAIETCGGQLLGSIAIGE